jgi:hypothetical protein
VSRSYKSYARVFLQVDTQYTHPYRQHLVLASMSFSIASFVFLKNCQSSHINFHYFTCCDYSLSIVISDDLE